MKPDVSILMPSYNYEKYIARAIDTVICQSFINWELVIIDDGSKDDSVNIIKQYKDKRIKLYTQSNHGVTNTLNRALNLSKGKYICFLDADDKYHPDKLKKQLKLINKGYDFVVTKVEAIDENGAKSTLDYFDSSWNSYNTKTVLGENIVFEFLHKNYFCKSSVMLKRSIFDKYGLFNEKLIAAYDLELWLRFISNITISRHNDILTYYRWHNKNETATNNYRIRAELLLVLDKYLSENVHKNEYNLLNKYIENINLCFQENNLSKGFVALQLIKNKYHLNDTFDILIKKNLRDILYVALQLDDIEDTNIQKKSIPSNITDERLYRKVIRKFIPFKIRDFLKNKVLKNF